MIVPLVILIVILMVLQCPDCSSFGQITSSAKGDADNHVTATPPLQCPACQACLARLRVGKRSFQPVLFGDNVGVREGDRIIGKSAVLQNQCRLFWSLLETSS